MLSAPFAVAGYSTSLYFRRACVEMRVLAYVC